MPLRNARREIAIVERGGTSFQPVADYFCAHPEYDGLIIFTDGYAEPPVCPARRPPDVLWVLTDRRAYEENRGRIKKLRGSRVTYIPH